MADSKLAKTRTHAIRFPSPAAKRGSLFSLTIAYRRFRQP
jgi:hypothetical protein